MNETMTPEQRGVFDFERAARWKWQGAKETAIRAEFGVTPTRYHQLLDAALDTHEALRLDPVTTRRLLRLREARRQVRSGRRMAG